MLLYQNRSYKNNFPQIDLGDYILREKDMNDLENFYEYFSDPQVNQYIISDIPQSLNEAKDELKYWIDIYYRGSGIYFGIARKKDNMLIGTIGITSLNKIHNRGEISYDLAKEFWNLGIMTKALSAINDFAFMKMKINRLEAFTLKENIASRKLLSKCGYIHEGELKQHRRHKGVYKDIGIFALIRENWLQNIKSKI